MLILRQFVSRMLVHLQGGKIHVQSKKCVGTVIRLFITVERASAPTSAERPTAMTTRRESVAALLETDDETRIANMRVLVVEVGACRLASALLVC
jgi:hypothetical protein